MIGHAPKIKLMMLRTVEVIRLFSFTLRTCPRTARSMSYCSQALITSRRLGAETTWQRAHEGLAANFDQFLISANIQYFASHTPSTVEARRRSFLHQSAIDIPSICNRKYRNP